MTIIIPRDDLSDLFPSATGDLEAALSDYYSLGPVRPEVHVGEDVVRIEVDVEKTEAYRADFDRAVGFAQRGKLLKARRILEGLVDRYPAESDLHRMLAQTHFEAGDGGAAVDPLIDALRWDPENVYALVLMGNVQFKTFGDVETARRYYDRAVAIDPDDHLTLNNLGAAMMESGRTDEARRYFEVALEAEPDYPNTHLGLALASAHSGDLTGAFEHAVEALKLADKGDPVHRSAVQTALKAAHQYTRGTDPEALFAGYVQDVERAVGKPVEVRQDPSIQNRATVEVAENHGRDRHVVKYKPVQTAAHLVAHELAHLDLIAEARAVGANKRFTTNERLRRQFVDDNQRAVQNLIRTGVPGERAAAFVGDLLSGLNAQVYNAPIDLFIEDRLHERLPDLRPVQFASLFGMLSEYAESATNKEVRKVSPRPVFEANVVYNLTHALQLRDLYGVDLVGDFGADRRLRREAERLYGEFLEVRGDRRPGEEYAFVEDWASDLGVDAYFELDDDDVPAGAPSTTGDGDPGDEPPSADEAADRVEADPLNLDDPARRERGGPMSLDGSPMASMAVTMYILDALQLFEGRDDEFVRSVAFEVAMLGNYGLDADDPEKKYTLRSVPGKKFSALHLLAYMYAGFKRIEPDLDAGLAFDDEYERAQAMQGEP